MSWRAAWIADDGALWARVENVPGYVCTPSEMGSVRSSGPSVSKARSRGPASQAAWRRSKSPTREQQQPKSQHRSKSPSRWAPPAPSVASSSGTIRAFMRDTTSDQRMQEHRRYVEPLLLTPRVGHQRGCAAESTATPAVAGSRQHHLPHHRQDADACLHHRNSVRVVIKSKWHVYTCSRPQRHVPKPPVSTEEQV
jgi:hypothetical protein